MRSYHFRSALIPPWRDSLVVGVTRRLIQGATATAERLLAQTPGWRVLNTAYIERLNGTFRARLAPLARRTHHLVHRKELLHAGM